MNTPTINFYGFNTPNGQKVAIALAEMELEYTYHSIDITHGDQHSPQFEAINPNSKIPALNLIFPDGSHEAIMESGAILMYLAESSQQFLPHDPRARREALQWLFFQVGHIGPMFGQFGHFHVYAREKCSSDYPLERYKNETQRLLNVLDHRLSQGPYMLGQEYSIVDMATFPWVICLDQFYKAADLLGLHQFKHVHAWSKTLQERPKLQIGLQSLIHDTHDRA